MNNALKKKELTPKEWLSTMQILRIRKKNKAQALTEIEIKIL